MASDRTFLLSWPAAFRYARVCLAAVCLTAILQGRPSSAAVSFCAAFVLYAVAVLLWPGDAAASAPLGLLMVDVVFFLCWIASVGGERVSLSAAFLTYILLSGGILHSWRETLVAGALPTLFIWIARPPAAPELLPCGVAGTAAAACFAFQKGLLVRRLKESSKEAERLRVEAQEARDAERQRIAADFHDGPLQSFISFQMRLQIVKTMLKRDIADGMDELEQLQELCRSQVAGIRAFIRGMRPPDDSAGLLTASARLVDLFQKDTGIISSFHRGAPLEREETEGSTEILQIIREALNNIQKHSKASRVAVTMGRVDNALELAIEDDGAGFPFGGAYTLEELDAIGLGPVSIKQRVRNLGGELTVDSRPANGAALRIRIPL